MIKKLTYAFILTIALFITANTSQADAYTTTNDQGHITDVRKIQNASYSERENVFYVYSEEDSSGSAWVMDFKPLKGETLKEFKKRVIGRYLIVKYTPNTDSDEEETINGKYIW